MTLLWLLALGLSSHLHLPNNPQEPSQEAAPEPCEAATQLVDRLQALLQKGPLFLDPDLTLSQLAQRLRVSAKELSKAIN